MTLKTNITIEKGLIIIEQTLNEDINNKDRIVLAQDLFNELYKTSQLKGFSELILKSKAEQLRAIKKDINEELKQW